jgi:hypothetical protein
MLDASAKRIGELLDDEAVVLDVGGWAKPYPRADWVLDLMPYDTRGLYGKASGEAERFTVETWIERDVCDREPWPFEDGSIDFAICSHTLEDVRDPVWVCSELTRVATSGYIEVPSRLEEQSYGIQGPWVGWSHHHWLTEETDGGIEFVLKPHLLQGTEGVSFATELGAVIAPDERVVRLFWEGGFTYGIFYEPEELEAWLREPIEKWTARLEARLPRRRLDGLRSRLGV